MWGLTCRFNQITKEYIRIFLSTSVVFSHANSFGLFAKVLRFVSLRFLLIQWEWVEFHLLYSQHWNIWAVFIWTVFYQINSPYENCWQCVLCVALEWKAMLLEKKCCYWFFFKYVFFLMLWAAQMKFHAKNGYVWSHVCLIDRCLCLSQSALVITSTPSRFLHFVQIPIFRLQMTDRLASRIKLKSRLQNVPSETYGWCHRNHRRVFLQSVVQFWREGIHWKDECNQVWKPWNHLFPRI